MLPDAADHRATAILLLVALVVIRVTYQDPALAEALGAAAGIVGTLCEVSRRDGGG